MTGIVVDLLDPALHASGEVDAVLDELRARAPIAWQRGRRGLGYWAVTGYPELAAIARDPSAFTSWWGTRPEVRRARGAARPLHNLDPPEHTALRRIATTLVARARIAALAPITCAAAVAALATLRAGDDAVAKFAVPVVARTFAAWLGLPDPLALHAAVEAVHAAGAKLLDAPDMDLHREPARIASSAIAEMMIAHMPNADADRVLGRLHALVDDGDGDGTLTRETAVMLAALLVEAGLPTTIDALTHALARSPQAPARLDAAIDDALAARPPIQQFARYATRDIELAGAAIRADQQVVLFYGPANRDPRRGDRPHLSFGAGPHRCLGAAFARATLTAALSEWYARIPAHTGIETQRVSNYQRGASSYIVVW